jgi:hypothetical protein
MLFPDDLTNIARICLGALGIHWGLRRWRRFRRGRESRT